MIKEFIGTGKTIDEATHVAKTGLNAPLTADVKIEVIEMPKKKILGLFGGSDAKVKASYDDGKKEKKSTAKPSKKAPKKPENKKDAPRKSEKEAEKKAPAPKKEPKQAEKKAQPEAPIKDREYPKSVDLEVAKSYLYTILKGLNIEDAKIDASYEDGVVTLDLECSDYGIVIGRRGETLDSIQYLLSLVMKKSANGYVRVVLNVADYREKRAEMLRNMAQRHSQYVLRTGRRYTFEPMNPYERRVIHTAVQEIEGVTSRSVGYDQNRRVMIEPEGGVVRPQRSNSGYRRGNGGRSNVVKSAPADYTPKADRADLPKFGKIEVNKD